jgi:hypothetical protein
MIEIDDNVEREFRKTGVLKFRRYSRDGKKT